MTVGLAHRGLRTNFRIVGQQEVQLIKKVEQLTFFLTFFKVLFQTYLEKKSTYLENV